MHDRMTTRTRKPYGPGFDTLGLADDGRAFRAWWNARSFFPVPDFDPAPGMRPEAYAAAA
jgi:hypothetical protein